MTASHDNGFSLKDELLKSIHDVPDFPKPGILFRDICPLLEQPALLKKVVAQMQKHALSLSVTHIVGIESRGFFFALPLSLALDFPFVAARKKGKLPGEVVSASYALEYGVDFIEIQKRSLIAGKRYLIVDDVIATGGTASAAAEIIEKSGAIVCGFSFLIELSFLSGVSKLAERFPHAQTQSLLQF